MQVVLRCGSDHVWTKPGPCPICGSDAVTSGRGGGATLAGEESSMVNGESQTRSNAPFPSIPEYTILDEIGAAKRVHEIVDSIGFSKNETTPVSGDMLKKIAAYADSRVVPLGVASLYDRLADMYERYATRHPKDTLETERNAKALYALEQELFAGLTLRPEDITEASVAGVCAELSHFDIMCSVG